jgi:hypothetical protein
VEHPSIPTRQLAATAKPTVVLSPGGYSADVENSPLWGTEVTLEEFIELARSDQADSIEWFTPWDRMRLNTKLGPRYNYKNAESKLDMAKVLTANGVVLGDEGIPFTIEV